ncbi:MAG TPA: PIN domain-containing protein [Candidatus Binatia bacterium]|nr:PIN domain-containing protein [Candidatus Binatia bacterium]
MSRIYWDTMLFIYWLENNPHYAPRVQSIREKMKARQDRLCTSAFTVGETLVGFHKRHDLEIAARVRSFFLSSSIEILPYTVDLADSYAEIRARLKVSSADAIHLACAAKAGIDLFLTNDSDLIGQIVPGIQFIGGLDSNIL